MDKQDADRALESVLADLEAVSTHDVASNPHGAVCKALAAVVLIGRRLVPGRTSADDATQPGKRGTGYEARRDGSLRPIRITLDQSPPFAPRRWPRDEDEQIAEADLMLAAEPTPALRAMFTGEPIPDEVPEPVGAFAWSRDEDERIAEADSLLAKDRAELAATLTQLEAERRKTAALQRVIDDARNELAGMLGLKPDATLTWLVNIAKEQHVSEQTWFRAFQKVGEALNCPGGEPSVLAAISTLKDDLRVAKERAEDEAARALDAERRMVDFDAARMDAIRVLSGFRNSLRDALGLPGNALDSVIVAKVREMGEVLGAAHKTIAGARVKLDGALGGRNAGQQLPLLPDLVARAVTHIEVLRSEHARERVTVDELRGMQAEMVEETEAAKDAANEARNRWDRIKPLIAALHEYTGGPGPAMTGRDARLAMAFARWKTAEREADADDGPADVPHQPDDPGVEEPEDVGAMGGDAP
jgi:hypothetical protein